MRRTRGRTRLAAAALVAAVGCAEGGAFKRGGGRYDRNLLEQSLAKAEKGEAGLVLGDFPLHSKPVLDGDTVKVIGLDNTLRLLAIDTEETFKGQKDKKAYADGFAQYLKAKRGDSHKPVKAATPMGEEARRFAEKFLAGVREVRLERDHPKEIKGRFGRYLAYVMVKKDGQWVNYNVESVRAGMTPYFMKYGYSRRFHDDFVQAQDEARAAKRGIWDETTENYRDYDERLRWWTHRADFIQAFEREGEDKDWFVSLTNWDSKQRLADLEGQEVVVLGLVGGVRRPKSRGPIRVLLSRRLFDDFPLIIWDEETLAATGLEKLKGEFVRARGVVTKYKYKKTGEVQYQMEVKLPGQIVRSNPFPGITGPDEAPPPSAVEPTPEPIADPVAPPEPEPEPEAQPVPEPDPAAATTPPPPT